MGDTQTVRNPERADANPPTESRDPIPAAVGWVLGAVVAIVALAMTAVGAGLYARSTGPR